MHLCNYRSFLSHDFFWMATCRCCFCSPRGLYTGYSLCLAVVLRCLSWQHSERLLENLWKMCSWFHSRANQFSGPPCQRRKNEERAVDYSFLIVDLRAVALYKYRLWSCWITPQKQKSNQVWGQRKSREGGERGQSHFYQGFFLFFFFFWFPSPGNITQRCYNDNDSFK